MEPADPEKEAEEDFSKYTNTLVKEKEISKELMMSMDEFNEFFHRNKLGGWVITTEKEPNLLH